MEVLLSFISGINSLVLVMITHPCEGDCMMRDYTMLLTHLSMMIRGYNLATSHQLELLPVVGTCIQGVYFYRIVSVMEGIEKKTIDAA